MSVSFKLLGTGAGPGVPAFWCNCPGCREARQKPEWARTRSGALIDTGTNKILIDASPDIRTQLLRENISRLDCIFLTHWHYDHFGGLGDLEFYIRLNYGKPLTFYLPASAVEDFQAAFPNLIDIFNIIPWEFESTYAFEGLRLTPLVANHGIETAGIWLQTPERSLAYFPDTAGLPGASARAIAGVDWLVCDATFYGENWYPHSHMNVDQAVQLGKAVNAGQTVLTHLSMHYSEPCTAAGLQQELQDQPQVILGYDGMTLKL